MMMWKLLAGLGAVIVALGSVALWQLVDRVRLRTRFGGILDLDREIACRRQGFERELAKRQIELEGEIATRRAAIDGEVASRTAELERARGAAMRELLDIMRKTSELQRNYSTTTDACERARAELSTLEQSSEAVALGLYPPSFTPSASEDYKHRLRAARDHQRAMVRDERALGYGAWSPATARGDGERMQRQYARLLLRAFNGECEAAIAKVRWNNVGRMAERLTQAFSAINRLGAVMQIQLTAAYRDCKLDELRLEYELDHQRRLEHEEQRALRDAPRGLDDAGELEHDVRLARGSMQIERIVADRPDRPDRTDRPDEVRVTPPSHVVVHAGDPDVKPVS